MSTAIAKNFQIGADSTPSNNFTLYQPASPDGTLRLGNGNTGTTSSLLTLTSAGNLGIGNSSPTNAVTVGTTSAGRNIAIYSSSNGNNGLLRMYDLGGTERLQLGVNSTGEAVYYAPTGSVHAWYVNTERMRIDASGNVGIGTSSPSSKLNVVGTSHLQGYVLIGPQDTTSFYQGVSLRNGRDSSGAETISYIDAQNNLGTIDSNIFFAHGADGSSFISFSTTPAGSRSSDRRVERARIDPSGNLLVGATSQVGPFVQRVGASFNGGTSVGIAIRETGAGSGSRFTSFVNSAGSEIGTIQQSGTSAVAYVTSSDYRLKHDIQPMTGALAKVAALKPVTYKWNADDSDGEGFIAHELAEVVPQCVAGEKDAVDAEGNPVYQGIDTSFLVATLTAAIQEQQVIIEQLKADVAALKGTAA